MRFSVMQPYLFPYIGYFQLIQYSDKFVFYDDVTFIKGGYINRNNILNNSSAQRFSIPVLKQSSNTKINDLFFDKNVKKVLRTIQQSYSKSPYFNEVFPIVEDVLKSDNRNVSLVCSKSIISIFDYLGINKNFYFSSDLSYDRNLSASDKLIEMSNILSANQYINSYGGESLYDKRYFLEQGVTLSFLRPKNVRYEQIQCSSFVENLSIIDVLMWNSRDQVRELLQQYEIL